MGKASAHGAAIAHRAIGDATGHPAQDVRAHIRHAPIFHVRMGDEGAIDHVAGLLAHCAQGVDAGEVHDQIGRGEAQVEHGAEGLRAGHGLRPVAAGGEEGRGAGDVARTLQAEGRGLHAALLRLARAASTLSTMRRGVTGARSISLPSGRSASLMALAMAAGGAMAPPSPMPFTPNVV